MIIGCDVDGVVADCGRAFWDHNQAVGRIPTDHRYADFTGYRIEHHYAVDYTCFDDDTFWRDIEVLPGARGFGRFLGNLGHVLWVSASRRVAARSLWLKHHGFSSSGYLSIPAKKKAQFALDFGIALFVEDDPDTLRSLHHTNKILALGVETRYNKHLKDEGIFIGDYSEILREIQYHAAAERDVEGAIRALFSKDVSSAW